MERKALIGKVHAIAFGELKLDRETYEIVVEGATGARSVKDLPSTEIEKVLVALRRFQRTGTGRPPTRGARTGQHQNVPQHKKIARLMDYLRWNWTATAKMCNRITGKSDTRDCDAIELRKLILAMIQMVDQNIESGKLVLTPQQTAEFRFYSQLHKKEAVS